MKNSLRWLIAFLVFVVLVIIAFLVGFLIKTFPSEAQIGSGVLVLLAFFLLVVCFKLLVLDDWFDEKERKKLFKRK
jgi:membrane protein YdbS with pleckstrin-like domain